MHDQNTNAPVAHPGRLLRLPEVIRLTGMGRTTIYKRIQEGVFPNQRKLSPTIAVWAEAEVMKWIDDAYRQPTATAAA